ncbi:hypothetical protein [Ellagibacter isourolithinifaciens]|uniref:hypothetical protein n=1 Tax=Ellagibacter isourolithinifaciens TaxID=2137581 RepID=UPI003A94D6BB
MKQTTPLDNGALGGRGSIANERGGAGSCRFGLGESKRFGIGAKMHGGFLRKDKVKSTLMVLEEQAKDQRKAANSRETRIKADKR